MSGELDRLAAACLLASFDGLTPPPWLLELVAAGLGGVVLFSRNVEDREQLSALTGKLHAARADLLIATDEEGGDVTRLEAVAGSSYPGNAALGAVDDLELTEEVGAAIGRDLAEVGVDLDLAPVADVNANPRNPIVGVRAFGSDPGLVARHVAAFVGGLQGAGVAACAKHFPGHGDTETDSHLELPTMAGDVEAGLEPFRAAVAAGVRAIMTAHLRVPELGDAPATLNPRILRDLLRDDLGFRGLVVTDALEMRAVSASVGIEEGAVRALAAGADALCLGADLTPEAVEGVRRAVTQAVRDGRLDEERLHGAAGRVAETAGGVSSALSRPRPRADVGSLAARAALRVEGSVSLTRAPFLVELVPEPSIAAGEAGRGLGPALGPGEVVRLRDAPRDVAAVLAGRTDRQLVVVVRDAHRHGWQREVAAALLASADDAVLVETGLPLWRPARVGGYVATFGCGRVNFDAAAAVLRRAGEAARGASAAASPPARGF